MEVSEETALANELPEGFSWKEGGWTYRLVPEGRHWRFTGRFQEGKACGGSDFGLLPGGAAVAIEKLVQEQSLSRMSIEEGQLIIGELSVTLAFLAGDDGLKPCCGGCPGHVKEKADAECKRAMAYENSLEDALRAVVAHAPPEDGLSDPNGGRWFGDSTILMCLRALGQIKDEPAAARAF
jgi:hypothetical protein